MNFGPLFTALFGAIVRLLERRKKIRELILPLIVKAAADGLPDNAARRDFVVNYTEQGMSESTARLLTEAGVALHKKIQKKLAKKAARKKA